LVEQRDLVIPNRHINRFKVLSVVTVWLQHEAVVWRSVFSHPETEREERKRNFSAEECFRQKYKDGCFKAEREAAVTNATHTHTCIQVFMVMQS